MKKFLCFLAIVMMAFTACVSDKNMDNTMQNGGAEQSGMMSEQSGMMSEQSGMMSEQSGMLNADMPDEDMPDTSTPEKDAMRGSMNDTDDSESMPRSMTDEM